MFCIFNFDCFLEYSRGFLFKPNLVHGHIANANNNDKKIIVDLTKSRQYNKFAP